jgi:hypothetical protein
MLTNLKYWLLLGFNLRQFIKSNGIHPDRLKLAISRIKLQPTSKKYDVDEAEKILKMLEGILKPIQVDNLVRIGGTYDGGYVIRDMKNLELLFSAGIGKNSEFEDAIANETEAKIFACDPTIENYPGPNIGNRIFFEKRWFSSSAVCDHKSKICLKEISFSDFQRDGDSLLKIDIEGSEYEILLTDWDLVSHFDQIVIEFHDFYKLSEPKFRDRIKVIFSNISNDYLCISFHSNNWAPVVNFGHSFCPDIFEVTLIKKSYPSFMGNGEKKDLQLLHKSNNPKFADIPHQIFTAQIN